MLLFGVFGCNYLFVVIYFYRFNERANFVLNIQKDKARSIIFSFFFKSVIIHSKSIH